MLFLVGFPSQGTIKIRVDFMKNNGTFLSKLEISNTSHEGSKQYSLESRDFQLFSKFLYQIATETQSPPKQVFFPSPKNKACLRKSSFVIPLRIHEETLLSIHFTCQGFGLSLNTSLYTMSQLQFSQARVMVLM